MRKIILNLAVSLDNFIEDQNGAFDWCFTDQDYGMAAFLEQTDTILLGRKSYELLLSMGDDNFPKHKKYVFSRNLDSVQSPYLLAKQPTEQAIRDILQTPGKDLWLFGGAELVASLLNAELIDECLLAVHPLFLGAGKPVFAGLEHRVHLDLIRSKPYSSGLVQLHYRFKSPSNEA